ncbi:ArsR/SmtB family transcription factor [Alkalicoccus urumqiensis]|uniref:ArsR family transcriptional regulator n=1 Tax=Alkalicoccus urumqiensis TaxID=1548213 RepID=A0A2P6MF45_ALKUR|nr:metalloregulator ArsR/SmtB family transcription factor [Alkalicoccus urumqiensis]PRO64870.1 ArsR family transcriptional regulator [Alkalicoccus urumqiensis]
MLKQTLSFEDTAVFFKLLGDKNRLKMISLLSADDVCVCEFVELLKMSQPSVSQHLRKLKQHGIVRERKQGQWVFYSLDQDSPYYDMALAVIRELPDAGRELEKMKQAGLRVICK